MLRAGDLQSPQGESNSYLHLERVVSWPLDDGGPGRGRLSYLTPSLQFLRRGSAATSYAPSRTRRRSAAATLSALARELPPATSYAPGRTRTCDPRLRRPVLYPAELRAPDTRREQAPAAGHPLKLAAGIEPATSSLPRMRSTPELREPAATSGTGLTGAEGLEPPTAGFGDRCSTS